MIAVQTNERLYLLNMEDSEFVSLTLQETMAGRTLEQRLIPLIRARSGISFNSNDMVRFTSSMISEISTCYTKVGDRFDTKPVNSIADLEFFIAPNGNQYSCREAYTEMLLTQTGPLNETVATLESIAKPVAEEVKEPLIPSPVAEEVKSVETAVPNPVAEEVKTVETKIPNPVAEEVKSTEAVAPNPVAEEAKQKEPEPYLGVVPGETVHKASGVIALPASLNDEFYRKAPEPTALVPFSRQEIATVNPKVETGNLDVIQISEEQKRAAGQLDNLVRKLPNVNNLPADIVEGMKNYVNDQREIFRGYAEEYLSNFSPLDRDQLYTSFRVPNALGKSHDMIDSLLVFPVHTRILTKKDMSTRFSPLDLVNATMVRVCPIGFEGDIIQSFVQEIKITGQDVKEAEEIVNAELKKQGKRKRSLSAKEKYDLMESALEDIMKNRKGSLAASRDTQLVQDLGRHFDKLVSTSKVYIPSLDEWNSYDVVAYDTREKVDDFPITLLTQLQNINGKTMDEVDVIFGGPEEDPFEEELNTPEENLSRTVRILKVDASEEAVKAGKTDLGYVEVAEDFLSLSQRDFIVPTQDGFVLDGYVFDVSTNEVITDLEYEDEIKKYKKVTVEDAEELDMSDEEIINPVRIYKVDTSEETLKVGITHLGYVAVAEDFLSESEKDAIVSNPYLGRVLEGYVFDINTKKLMTDLEYAAEVRKYKKSTTVEEAEKLEEALTLMFEHTSPLVQEDHKPLEETQVLTDTLKPETKTEKVVVSAEQKKEEHAEPLSPGLETVEEPGWKLPDRKYRAPIVVMIPTVFSKGLTEEKIANLPEYKEFVTLSEDDMLDEIKAAIRPTEDGGYTLKGYCFDYDQVRLITEEEYLKAIMGAPVAEEVKEETVKIPPKQDAIPNPVKATETAFQPIVGEDTKNVTMGGIPLGGTKKETEVQAPEPIQTTGEPLTDYVKPDGTYVDPTGEEWSSKDEYTLYKMLSDDQYLSEEEKGKQI